MATERRPWTYQDEWTLRNEFPRRPTEEVAAMLHRSVKATSVRAHKLGLKKVHYGIVWTPQMLKMVKDYYPIMFNTPLAKMLGVSKRTLNRKAIELGVRKPEDFIEKRRRDISRIESEAMKRCTGNISTRFRKGEHRNPAGEFKTGPREESAETKARRSASLKDAWRLKKLMKKYGFTND